MARGSLRRYDVQAVYAGILAVLSVLPFLGAVVLVLRNYRPDMPGIVYNTQGMYDKVLLACLGLSVMAGGLGLVLGWSSAGQRRNTRSKLSWLGFFLGGSVVTLGLILLFAFMQLRVGITPGAAP